MAYDARGCDGCATLGVAAVSCQQDPFASRPSTGERPPMTNRIARLRDRLSYANVTATLALFIALGGSSYAAIALPRNSVGAKQIRTSAVGSNKIRNGTIKTKDISRSARAALRGQRGPAGPVGPGGPPPVIDHAQFNSLGDMVSGTAVGAAWNRADPGLYRIQFRSDVSKCAYSATLAAVPGGEVTEPSPGRITVASGGGPTVVVKTYDAAGTFSQQPFHVIVVC